MKELKTIQKETGIESLEQVHHALILFYINKTISTKTMAQMIKLPVPIVTALKKELVSSGYLIRESFYVLSLKGIEYVESQLNLKSLDTNQYQYILDTNSNRNTYTNMIMEDIEIWYQNRPKPKMELDQAHATRETVIQRVIKLMEDPLIFSKSIVFLGDDNLVSILLFKAINNLGVIPNITVLYIDADILNHVESFSNKKIITQMIDFRDEAILNNIKADIILMDPPYTIAGVETFTSTANKILNDHGKVYLSMSHKTKSEQFQIQTLINQNGWMYTEILENFNSYLGGSIIGNKSNLYVIQTFPFEDHETSIYTADSRKSKNSIQLGYQSMYELRDCDYDTLANVDVVRRLLYEVTTEFNLHAVTDEFHQFNPYGVSGAIISQESHLAIHTWPEHHYAAVDLFVCHPGLNEYKVLEFLKESFKSNRATVRKTKRTS